MLRALALSLALLFPACSEEPPPRYETAADATAGGVKLIVLRDREAGVEAAVAPEKGGELSSLRVRVAGDWVETIYLANDFSPRQGWSGKAPLLFPATGRSLPEDLQQRARAGEPVDPGAYELNGKRYPMPAHGFARDFPWETLSSTAAAAGASARLRLRDNEKTREFYPFRFEADVEYDLRDGRLEIRYTIASSKENSSPMEFSIGNHITFKTPLLEGTPIEEMVLVTPSTTRLLKDDLGFPNGETEPRSHADGVKLSRWEVKVPISLTGYEGDPWVLLGDPGGLAIRLSHTASRAPRPPAIQFNIWGDPPNGYISPEPWMGMQNSLNSGQGLISLAPGKSLDWTIRIEFE